ncbi:MAG: putative lipoprotein, partial [Phycisphaerales bacterium]|nr:putative lipoprotein [Phycisphaerales bacterium]
MARRLLTLLPVTSLVLVGTAACGWWMWGRPDPVSADLADAVSAALADAVPASGERTVDLARVAGFDWDTVHFFGPYRTRAEVERTLGFPWPGLGGSRIEHDDGVTLVVFVKGGRVVRSFDHRRAAGDYAGEDLARPGGFARADARFVVRRDGGRPTVSVAVPTAAPA